MEKNGWPCSVTTHATDTGCGFSRFQLLKCKSPQKRKSQFAGTKVEKRLVIIVAEVTDCLNMARSVACPLVALVGGARNFIPHATGTQTP
jgi:hypothetical protein